MQRETISGLQREMLHLAHMQGPLRSGYVGGWWRIGSAGSADVGSCNSFVLCRCRSVNRLLLCCRDQMAQYEAMLRDKVDEIYHG